MSYKLFCEKQNRGYWDSRAFPANSPKEFCSSFDVFNHVLEYYRVITGDLVYRRMRSQQVAEVVSPVNKVKTATCKSHAFHLVAEQLLDC